MNSITGKRNFLQFNKQGAINLFRAMKRLMHRSGPSNEHKKAWAEFDMILMIRANISQFLTVLQTVGWFIFGTMPYQLSRKYIDDGKPYNKDFIDNYFDYIKYAFICIEFLRVVTILLSYKWINITKYYIYIAQF